MNVTGNSKKEKKFISLVVYLHNVEEYIRFSCVLLFRCLRITLKSLRSYV